MHALGRRGARDYAGEPLRAATVHCLAPPGCSIIGRSRRTIVWTHVRGYINIRIYTCANQSVSVLPRVTDQLVTDDLLE